MKIMRVFLFIRLSLLAVFPALLLSCSTAALLVTTNHSPENAKPIFIHAVLNGQPMRLAMDTNSITTLLPQGAKKAGLKPIASPSALHEKEGLAWLAESSQLEIGTQVFTARFEVYPAAQTPGDSYFVDGLLGWPVVRGNILFFDSQEHTVSRLEKLPGEVTGWLKFKILPGELLAIEVPLPNGQTGNLRIDSGDSSGGVTLPATQYKQWRSAHSEAPIFPFKYFTNGTLTKSSERAWADEVQVGPLVLTDVPVRPANDDEASWVKNFAGELGMYAFERMNAIFDYPGGFAYLQPKPPPGPPYPFYNYPGNNSRPFLSYDWKVADNVKINLAVLDAQSGKYKTYWKDYTGGISDYNRAIELESKNAEFYMGRGTAREGNGDIDGAIADETQALILDPGNTDAKTKLAALQQRKIKEKPSP